MSCSPFSNVYDTSAPNARPTAATAPAAADRDSACSNRAAASRRGRVHVRRPAPAGRRPPALHVGPAGERGDGQGRVAQERDGGRVRTAERRRLDVDVHEVGRRQPVPAHAGRLLEPRPDGEDQVGALDDRRDGRRRVQAGQAEGLGNTLVDHAPARGRGQHWRAAALREPDDGRARLRRLRAAPGDDHRPRRPAQRGRRGVQRVGRGHRAGGVRRAPAPRRRTGSPRRPRARSPRRRRPGSRCTRGASRTAAPTAGRRPARRGGTTWRRRRTGRAGPAPGTRRGRRPRLAPTS